MYLNVLRKVDMHPKKLNSLQFRIIYIKLYDFLDISKMTDEIIYSMNIFCIVIQKTKKNNAYIAFFTRGHLILCRLMNYFINISDWIVLYSASINHVN